MFVCLREREREREGERRDVYMSFPTIEDPSKADSEKISDVHVGGLEI